MVSWNADLKCAYVYNTNNWVSPAYRTMLQSGPQVFERIFRYLIANPRSPFIIHCTAGKDRTGVFVMLLLGLCGVDDEVIAREYELTNLGWWGMYCYS